MARISRREFGTAVAGGLLAARSLRAQTPQSPGTATFPFGTHVYREPHLPLDEIRRDLPLLKRLGFNMVKVQESWAIDEPREGAVRLDDVVRVIADAREQALSVFFGVTMEQAPAWLWRKHPDAVPLYEDGAPHADPTPYLLPSDGKPGPCWHHPGARAAAERFLRVVGSELARFDNVAVWSVAQEVGFFSWDFRPGHFALCYCPHTLAAYRDWLRRRYAALAALNEEWKTGYGAWDEIEPPRRFRAVPAWIDWRRFMEVDSFAEALRWKGEALRGGRSDRAIMAHLGGPTVGASREWSWARAVDVFGTSFYPLWDEPPFWSAVPMKTDLVRSASRDGAFWTAELQGGPVSQNLVLGRVPTPAEIRRWVLGSVGCGARGVCFWNHRAERLWSEGYGFGLLDTTGERSERAEEAGRIGRALATEAELFAHGRHPEPAVAIAVGEDLLQFVTATGEAVRRAYVDDVTGLWKGLWDEGIPAAFVPLEELAASASRYRALLLPYPVALAGEVIEALRAYVRGGGTLVSSACPGRFSRVGLGFAGEMAPGLEDLFGARHGSLTALDEPKDPALNERWPGTGRTAMLPVVASFRAQVLLPARGEPVAVRNGDAVGVHNAFGQGHAWLFGTLLGHAALRGDRANARLLAEILAPAGVLPDRCGALVRRRRVLGQREAWFLFNPREERVQASFSLEGRSRVRDLLDEPLDHTGDKVSLHVEPLDVRCLVLRP
jgi:beta-galactosidase